MDKNDLMSTHNNRVYDNFLVHWKYVKREKITGAKKGENKWKYFYKDDKSSKNKVGIVDKIKDVLGYDEKETYEKSKTKLDEARANAKKAKEMMDKASDELDVAFDKKRAAKKASTQKRGAETEWQRKKNLDVATKQVEDASKKYLDAVDKVTNASKKASTAYNEYSVARDAYEDTAVYKVSELYDNARTTIDCGREAVSELLDKVDDKLDSFSEDLKDKAEEAKQKVDELVDKVSDFLDPAERKAKQEAEERAEAERARQEAERARQAAEAYAKQAREDALARGEEALSELPMKTREYSKDEDQAAINPNYEEGEEWQTNCAYCTAAYDLRRRGYDVEAMPCDDATYDATLDSIPTWYEDTSKADWSGDASVDWFGRIDYDNISKIHEDTKKTFDEMPDGSYGQFCVYWTIGGGHSMAWEKENGTTYIRDCQTNETVTHDEWVSYYGDWSYGAYVLRTDNRVPSKNILKTVKERENKLDDTKKDTQKEQDDVFVYEVGQKQDTKKRPTQFR